MTSSFPDAACDASHRYIFGERPRRRGPMPIGNNSRYSGRNGESSKSIAANVSSSPNSIKDAHSRVTEYEGPPASSLTLGTTWINRTLLPLVQKPPTSAPTVASRSGCCEATPPSAAQIPSSDDEGSCQAAASRVLLRAGASHFLQQIAIQMVQARVAAFGRPAASAAQANAPCCSSRCREGADCEGIGSTPAAPRPTPRAVASLAVVPTRCRVFPAPRGRLQHPSGQAALAE